MSKTRIGLDIPNPGTALTIVALAVFQSALLLFAHESIDREWWLARNNGWLVAWYTLVLSVPGCLYLLLRDAARPAAWLLAVALGLILLPQAWYTGNACAPLENIPCGPVLHKFVMAQLIAWFVVVHFLQTGLDKGRPAFDYHALFEYGWHNALTLALSLLFLGIFWCLLWLWAALFGMIEIEFFKELFSDRRFVYPVSGMVFGFGIVICRTRINAVATVRQIILAIFRALLPLLSAIGLLFVAALPFTGLEPLWDTWSAATLLGWLILLSVVFLNAVYQDGDGPQPYPRGLMLAVHAALLALPVFAALALWALWARVEQYGWSVDRLWGLVVLGILALYAMGYAVAVIVSNRTTWLPLLPRINVLIAFAIIAVVWATSLPLLDLRKIASADHVARTTGPEANTDELDLKYLRFELGRPGIQALHALRDSAASMPDSLLPQRIDAVLDATTAWSVKTPEVDDNALNGLFVIAPGSPPPATELLRAIVNDEDGQYCTRQGKPCTLKRIPLSVSGDETWLLFNKNRSYQGPLVFGQCGEQWCKTGSLEGRYHRSIWEEIMTGDFELTAPQYRELQIGTKRYVVVPENESTQPVR